ncbi:MAG TPA: phosphoenolpyruvate--protein phosphotransferase [bacterium]|nr:phosphoenolpyruvate--protein phosphotransferase [bacterium]
MQKSFRGVAVSPGFAQGVSQVYRPYTPAPKEVVLGPGQVADELKRFRQALHAAERELHTLHTQVKRDLGPDFADFIEVQLTLLHDEEVVKNTEAFIREALRNAEFAYSQTVKLMSEPVAKSEVPLFKERMLDIADVSNRVMRHLLGDDSRSLLEVAPGTVIFAHDLPPSEAALLDPRRVVGLVLEAGGKTSHTAIMAKAKEIPAVMGAGTVCEAVTDGLRVFVDGFRGVAIINPTKSRLRAYEDEIERRRAFRESLSALATTPPVTVDGRTIDLSANIEFIAEAKAAKRYGARGVGLFRTEYMYLAKRRQPTEEEQFLVYSEVAKMFKPYPVIIRTFDLGGDKVLAGYTEANPFLGLRAIRLTLNRLDLFGDQLRAILRASAFGNVKVMFPMVSTIEELRRGKLEVERAKGVLKARGVDFDPDFEVGVMVETPSAAIMADRLARECSFLSIGSNDLTQYTLAVDRGNEHVAKLFDHMHPAVLHLIKQTVDAAHQQGIWVGMCGEFASDLLGMLVLLGMGVDEMSVSPGMIPEAKGIIRNIDGGVAAEIVAQALKLGTALEVQRLLRREMDRKFPHLAGFQFEENKGK